MSEHRIFIEASSSTENEVIVYITEHEIFDLYDEITAGLCSICNSNTVEKEETVCCACFLELIEQHAECCLHSTKGE